MLQDFAREHFAARNVKAFHEFGRGGLSEHALAFALAAGASALAKGQRILSVVATNQDAEQLAAELSFFLKPEQVVFVPGLEGIPFEYAPVPGDIAVQRGLALSRLLADDFLIAVTSVTGALRRLQEPDVFRAGFFEIKPGQRIEPKELAARLFGLGYDREEIVEAPGHFAIKAGIVDVFPTNADAPVRLEFFDDELESIRSFDPDTQIGSKGVNDRVVIAPASEFFVAADQRARLLAALEHPELIKPDWAQDPEVAAKASGGSANDGLLQQNGAGLCLQRHPGLQDVYGLAFPLVDLVDWFAKTPIVVSYPARTIAERREALFHEYRHLSEEQRKLRVLPAYEQVLSTAMLAPEQDSDEVAWDAVGDSLTSDAADTTDGLPLRRGLVAAEGFSGRIREVRSEIARLVSGGEQVLLVSPYEPQVKRIAAIFEGEQDLPVCVSGIDGKSPSFGDIGFESGRLEIVCAPLRGGFRLPAKSLFVWSDTDLFGRSYRKKTARFKRIASKPIDSFVDLKVGDHVVHVNHGVGRFVKLERVKAAGRERDFLVLEYADEDRLFVPLDQISLVQRYIAPNDSPRLDHLGKSSFKKIKQRVEERVEKLAEELVQIYAVRMSRQGFAYPPDTAWQEEFEADFGYEETPDQLASIEAVKSDMESTRPMDRLICGDVGYGKTEVAIRAAFKAVMAGKQVVLIAPTTILALQHFRTFTNRFADYPVRVDWISRFRSGAETTKVKRNAAAGEIDILIGTHALISPDVRLKNLGLLVVDEEQRFGVAHKEAIKSMRKLVDVLTLSATPIPRTLHMSLVGIRDLSLIQTPPRDRLPVRTYVMEDSDSILKEAILRELERGGQVFYLHNRVETIEPAARRISNLVPRAGVRILHGQMEEHEIEDTLLDFLEGRYDVLVTTTIIESGIDMPNFNTLIIDRADTFGLSQLYQIRGRVGRSDRQAYAYLFYPSGRALTETAQKRLTTIQEYQELGSGFKVAMRDLEIRGAGNILGREQSGDIMDVGFELYVRLLDNAVRRLQGQPVADELRCYLSLNRDFFLPEDYIPDSRQRIEFYKRFEAALSPDEVEQLTLEMQDRFGKPPQLALDFAAMENIRTLASIIGLEAVTEEDDCIRLKPGETLRVPVTHFVAVVQKRTELRLLPGNPPSILYAPKERPSLRDLGSLLADIAEPLLAASDDQRQTAVAGSAPRFGVS